MSAPVLFTAQVLYKSVSPLAVSLLFLLVCLGLYAAYLAYVHPLAKYPGPALARITTARAAYHAWKGDLHLDMWLCHRRYGSAVRYGPNHLIFESSAALKDIYTAGQNVAKPDMYQGLSNERANLLTLADKKEHSRRRRLIGRGFTDSSLRAFTPRLVEHIQRFCASLEYAGDFNTGRAGQWSRPLDMEDWCSYLTFDIMCDFVFGVNYNLLGKEDCRHVINDIEDANVRAAVLIWAPYLYVGRLDKILFKDSVRARNRYLQFLHRLIAEASAREARDHDIFGYLSSLKGAESATLDHRQILSESSVLVVAGYDTTATALCALLFYLSRNPHVYSKVSQEIRSKFAPGAEILSPRQLDDTPYLFACIDETLRMSPSVAACLFREVGNGGVTVDNHFIEPGTLIGNGIYSLHHNPRNFERPDEFLPERWLDDGNGMDKVKLRAAHAPFSTGSRACSGKSLALMELSMTVATLLLKYDFRIAGGEAGHLGAGHVLAGPGRTNPTEFQLYDKITCGKKGPLIQFKPLSV